jgi:hypothetical protein
MSSQLGFDLEESPGLRAIALRNVPDDPGNKIR